MRKLFLGTMLTSLLGSAVIGAALAWTNTTASSPLSATAGAASASVTGWVGSGNKVLPTGLNIKVGDAGITNLGDVGVHVTGGAVSAIDTSDPGCDDFIDGVNNILGDGDDGILGVVTVTNPGTVGVGASFSPLYDVFLNMGTSAPNGCQTQGITFNLTIDIAT